MEELIFTCPVPEESAKTLPCVPLTDYIFDKMQQHIDKTKDTAWVTDTVHGTRVLFSEVEPLSRKVASALTRRGFRKGELLYFVTNEMALLDLFILGAWRCNGAVKGGCPSTGEDEQYVLMKECDAKFVLCDQDTEEHVKNVVKRLPWDVQLFSIGEVQRATSIEELLKDDGKAFPENLVINPKEDVIYIPTTSGSTGLPKGAMYTHNSLIYMVYNFRYVLYDKDIVITFTNFHFSGLFISLHHLMKGLRVFTIPVYSGEKVLEAVTKYKPNMFGGFPYVLVWLLKTPISQEYNLSSLEYMFTGGAALERNVVEGLKTKLPNLKTVEFAYGQTECSVVTCSKAAKMFNIPQAPDSKVLSSGVVFPFVDIKVTDLETGKTLGKGQKGELRVKCHSVMKGYLKKPKETKESFDEDGWLSTGDIGYFDDNGHLYVVERLKETFKYQAHHISPSELEGLLQSHPAVMAAGVLGVPDPECTTLPRAYVVKKPGHYVTEDELQKYVEERTPYYKHLRGGVIFVDQLPMSPAGKLSRPMLKKLLE